MSLLSGDAASGRASSRRRLALAVLLLLCLGAILVWSRDIARPEPSFLPASVPSDHGARTSKPSPSETANLLAGRKAVLAVSGLRGVRTLSELAKRARAASRFRGQALVELQRALAFCETWAVQSRWWSTTERQQMQTPEGRRRVEYRRHAMGRFCDDPSLTSQAITERLAALDAEDPVAQSLVLDFDQESVNPMDLAIAERLGRQWASPAALERASWYLAAQGKMLPAAANVSAPASIRSLEDRLDAQHLAVLMVGCRVRGGCGPGEFNTLVWCPGCAPSESLEQGWRRKYTLEWLAYANAIANAIIIAQPRDSR